MIGEGIPEVRGSPEGVRGRQAIPVRVVGIVGVEPSGAVELLLLEEGSFRVVLEVCLHRWRIGDIRWRDLLLRYSPRRPVSASAARPTPATCARRGAAASSARAIRPRATALGSPAD